MLERYQYAETCPNAVVVFERSMQFATECFIRPTAMDLCTPLVRYQLEQMSSWGSNYFQESKMAKVYIKCDGRAMVDRVKGRARPSETCIR